MPAKRVSIIEFDTGGICDVLAIEATRELGLDMTSWLKHLYPLISQKPNIQGFVFTEQSEEKMLCLKIGRSELAGFVAREKDDAPRLLRITFKHKTLSPEFRGSMWVSLTALHPRTP